MSRTNLKFIAPEHLYAEIANFTKGLAVTRDKFELVIPRCTMMDMEWNHMDQMHRPHIHNTYEKGIRIALGKDFAVSLTQFGRWPLFITVTDTYVAPHTFYQSMTIAGVIFLHSIISFTDVGNDSIKLKNEWFIASHKLWRFSHKFLSKKLYNLNVRLQEEDAQIRHQRFDLRQAGFTFRSDPPDFYNSNRKEQNTLYPPLQSETAIELTQFSAIAKQVTAGNLDFIIKQTIDGYQLWPAACPHEGGPLLKGKFCSGQITCPWHGLRFSAVTVSPTTPCASRYGFEYNLLGDKIYIQQVENENKCPAKNLEEVSMTDL